MDRITDEIRMERICAYDFRTGAWGWKFSISPEKKIAGEEENMKGFQQFSQQLEWLANRDPINRNMRGE